MKSLSTPAKRELKQYDEGLKPVSHVMTIIWKMEYLALN
jgi:hypothetical protein